jgi:hypothetical protein
MRNFGLRILKTEDRIQYPVSRIKRPKKHSNMKKALGLGVLKIEFRIQNSESRRKN